MPPGVEKQLTTSSLGPFMSWPPGRDLSNQSIQATSPGQGRSLSKCTGRKVTVLLVDKGCAHGDASREVPRLGSTIARMANIWTTQLCPDANDHGT